MSGHPADAFLRPVAQWGQRLADQVRATLADGERGTACRLALEGDGQARDLARDYAFMARGLGLTLQVMLRLLMQRADSGDGDAAAASDDLTALLEKLLSGLTRAAGAESSGSGQAATNVVLVRECEQALAVALQSFATDQAQRAAAVVQALHSEANEGPVQALEQLDAKDEAWLQLHDPMVRFMAEAMAWVLRHRGPEALLEYHLATAEGQRAGFDKWERMGTSEFAATTAFLLQQHMGRVQVQEDSEKFTIRQSPCGSGGRLRLMGAYQGAQALPFVQGASPLTFGRPEVPVYCSHCAVWNGTATLRWYGRAHWVFSDPARPDGGCILHIYKRRQDAPADYTRRVTWPAATAGSSDGA
ncbi:MAG: hypothetical protein MUC86_01685 [Burkholderiaceae bacterium]|jgi:hypothetical protein|nr:hypothetical protein [Burkholderiaceae bacterium]